MLKQPTSPKTYHLALPIEKKKQSEPLLNNDISRKYLANFHLFDYFAHHLRKEIFRIFIERHGKFLCGYISDFVSAHSFENGIQTAL